MNITALENLISSRQIHSFADCPLDAHSSFRIGGRADLAVWPASEDDLAALVRTADDAGIRFVIIGNGSNVLFDDDGFRGTVIFTTRLRAVEIDGRTIFARCGAPLTSVAADAARNELSGLEFAYGIPGSVGGAVYMNAGAYDGEMKDVVIRSTAYDRRSGDIVAFEGEEHLFGYRDSVYLREGDRYVILGAEMKLHHGSSVSIYTQMEDYMGRRREKQPLEYPSAGSVFKRCPGYYTAKLIDEAGLKGCRVGGAEVSTKHAGFIVNRGGASSSDVLELVGIIKAEILRRNGIEIECEIRHIRAEA